jgi:hypothetical protein
MPEAELRVRDAVKRPSASAFRRTQRMTPQQRIDRAFALLDFASSLRSEIAFRR